MSKLARTCLGGVCTAVGAKYAPTTGPEETYFTGTALNEFQMFQTYGLELPNPGMIAYPRLLRRQWIRKVTKFPSRQAAIVGLQLTQEYDSMDPQRTTLRDYMEKTSEETVLLPMALDWELIGKLYRLTPNEVALTKKATESIAPRTLMAIAMTEHRVGRNGSINKDFFDFRLRYGGSQFIERIPAGADRFVSYGPYQLTSWALYDANNKRRGASIVNQALPPDLRVPGSVSKVRGRDHTRAAYLFAVHNFSYFIGTLGPRQQITFAKALENENSQTSIASFLGAAHNLPLTGFRAGRDWLSAGAKEPYYYHLNYKTPVGNYARITARNYAAI